MTLSPEEARAAVREAELAQSAREGLGNQVMSIVLGGLSLVPLYFGTVAILQDANMVWLGVAAAVTIAILGATLTVSHKARDRSRTFSQVYGSTIAANMAVFAVVMVLAIWRHPSWSTAFLHGSFLLVVPLVGATVLAVVSRRA